MSNYHSRDKNERTLIDEYMNHLCAGMDAEQAGKVFMIAIGIGTLGLDLKDPQVLRAMEVCTSFVAFLQGLDKGK